jgi:hypothetical protein
MIDIEYLKYPIGKFAKPDSVSEQQLKEAISYLKEFPIYLAQTVSLFTETQLETPYRPGGWTVKEVVHHLADSHMNMFLRFKLALAEESPTISPYNESVWSKMEDYKLPVTIGLNLVSGVHSKLGALMDVMQTADFERTYFHPESKSYVPLFDVINFYKWHSEHHLAHIQYLMIRENW